MEWTWISLTMVSYGFRWIDNLFYSFFCNGIIIINSFPLLPFYLFRKPIVNTNIMIARNCSIVFPFSVGSLNQIKQTKKYPYERANKQLPQTPITTWYWITGSASAKPAPAYIMIYASSSTTTTATDASRNAGSSCSSAWEKITRRARNPSPFIWRRCRFFFLLSGVLVLVSVPKEVLLGAEQQQQQQRKRNPNHGWCR